MVGLEMMICARCKGEFPEQELQPLSGLSSLILNCVGFAFPRSETDKGHCPACARNINKGLYFLVFVCGLAGFFWVMKRFFW